MAKENGANNMVVELFAFLHDICRENDGYDPHHGARAAELASDLRGNLFYLSAADFDLLVAACRGHTHENNHQDPTVGTCWDADRLDLTRFDIIPYPDRLITYSGKARALSLINA